MRISCLILAGLAACTGSITQAGLPATEDGSTPVADAAVTDAAPGSHPDASSVHHPDGSTTPTAGAGAPPPGAYFPSGAPWYQDVSSAAVDPNSAAIIAYLNGFGWATS